MADGRGRPADEPGFGGMFAPQTFAPQGFAGPTTYVPQAEPVAPPAEEPEPQQPQAFSPAPTPTPTPAPAAAPAPPAPSAGTAPDPTWVSPLPALQGYAAVRRGRREVAALVLVLATVVGLGAGGWVVGETVGPHWHGTHQGTSYDDGSGSGY